MTDRAWRDLPEPARAIAVAAGDAVAAARSADPAAFTAATEALAARDPEQAGLVLGSLVRALLEDLHPDGLTAADVQAIVARCVRWAASWYPDADPGTVVILLADALGVYQSAEERPALQPRQTAVHGALVVADLTTAAGRPVEACLRAAFADIARSQTMEAP